MDQFFIPMVNDLLGNYKDPNFSSKLDPRVSYHQILVHPPHVEKIAFRTHESHYEFLVMSFGLTNAPVTFQSTMNRVFKYILRKFVLVFFDDILIFSETKEDHWLHLVQVFDILRKHKLLLKLLNALFFQEELQFLGSHYLS